MSKAQRRERREDEQTKGEDKNDWTKGQLKGEEGRESGRNKPTTSRQGYEYVEGSEEGREGGLAKGEGDNDWTKRHMKGGEGRRWIDNKEMCAAQNTTEGEHYNREEKKSTLIK